MSVPIHDAEMRSHGAKIAVRAAMLVALVVMLVAPAALCAGCGDHSYQTAVDAALQGASAALVAKDAVAWFRALPADGDAAAQAWYQTYAGLARFPWAEVSAKADPFGDVPLDKRSSMALYD